MRDYRLQFTSILLFLFATTYTNRVQAQETELLSEILKTIETQYDVSFSYATDLIDGLKVETPSLGEIESTLKELSLTTNYSFQKVGERNFLIVPMPLHLCLNIQDSQDGIPLQGAYILHKNHFFEHISDENGRLEFERNLNIRDTVRVRYLGFEDKTIAVSDIYHMSCVKVSMNFGHTILNEIIVKSYMAPGINTSSQDHSIEIKTTDLALLPGETDNDILLSLRTLPGITAPSGKGGNLHVRGSTSDQTMILFDNIPIYHKGHYLGTISPYNPAMVDNVIIHRSGYEPRLGGRVGGAIELNTSRKVLDSTQFGVGLNTYYGSVVGKVPLIKNKLMASVAYRQSYDWSVKSPKLQAIRDMVNQPSIVSFIEKDPNRNLTKDLFNFYDLNSNLLLKIKKGMISSSFLNVNNTSEYEFENVTNGSITSFKTDLKNWGLNTEWSQFWTSRFNTSLSFMTSDYYYNSAVLERDLSGAVLPRNIFDNTINDLNGQFNGNYILNKKKDSELDFGYSFNQQEVKENSLNLRQNTPVENSKNNIGQLHSIFLNYSVTFIKDKLSFNGGVRGNYYNLLKDYRLEPRVFLNYVINPSVSLKSSFGLYSQYINQLVYFDFEDSKVENLTWLLAGETPIVTSTQFMIGGLYSRNSWIIDLELYSKVIDGLSTRNPTAMPQDLNQFFNGSLNTLGLDFLVKRNWDNFFIWAGYTYSKSEMQYKAINQLDFLTYYDQPHVFSLAATWSVQKWSISSGYNYMSGTPNYENATFFPESGSNSPQPPSTTVPSETNNGRFKPQHQLDISVVYSIPERMKKWKASIGLSIVNVYDRKNLVEETYVTFGPTRSLESRYAIGFAPNLTMNITW